MGYVVIKSGIVECSHEGFVPFTTGNPLLTVNGVEVVVSGMETGISITNCPFMSGSNPSPCSATNTATTGVAMKLRVAGLGVLLDSAVGTTVNTPPATWDVKNPGQSILSAE